jgi:hypothetical protein
MGSYLLAPPPAPPAAPPPAPPAAPPPVPPLAPAALPAPLAAPGLAPAPAPPPLFAPPLIPPPALPPPFIPFMGCELLPAAPPAPLVNMPGVAAPLVDGAVAEPLDALWANPAVNTAGTSTSAEAKVRVRITRISLFLCVLRVGPAGHRWRAASARPSVVPLKFSRLDPRHGTRGDAFWRRHATPPDTRYSE